MSARTIKEIIEQPKLFPEPMFKPYIDTKKYYEQVEKSQVNINQKGLLALKLMLDAGCSPLKPLPEKYKTKK